MIKEIRDLLVELARLPIPAKIGLSVLLILLLAGVAYFLLWIPQSTNSFVSSVYALPSPLRSGTVAAAAILVALSLFTIWRQPGEGNVDGCGLVEIRHSFLGFDYDELILNSEDLTVVLNDGRSWVSSHKEKIEKRLADPKKRTRFCFVHPKSQYLPSLLKKNGKTAAQENEELKRSFEIIHAAKSRNAHFELKGHDMASTYTLYMSESEIIVNPYYFNEAGELPLLRFKKSDASLYWDYKKDVDTLLTNARTLKASDF